MNKRVIILIISSWVIGIIVIGFLVYKLTHIKPEVKTITKIVENKVIKKVPVYIDSNSSLVGITKDDLKDYLYSHYNFLSNKSKMRIYDAILKYSKKYNISPIILFAVLHTESSMRFWIKHSRVYVSVPINQSKTRFVKIHTRAIGLGGVIWEMWKWDLIKAKIATTKSDLYNIDTNVEATAFILKTLREKPILKGVKTPMESAIIRYYGVIPKNPTYYLDKVNNFIGNLLSIKLYLNDVKGK